jgi:hypothetical protein
VTIGPSPQHPLSTTVKTVLAGVGVAVDEAGGRAVVGVELVDERSEPAPPSGSHALAVRGVELEVWRTYACDADMRPGQSAAGFYLRCSSKGIKENQPFLISPLLDEGVWLEYNRCPSHQVNVNNL